MSEDVKTEEGTETPVPSAGTQNTETAEHMIPKSRFDEVNKELKAVKAKLSGYETERMTESERLQAQTKAAQEAAATASQRLQQALADAAISRAAAAQGVDPELLSKLVTVELDDTGAPVGLEAAVAAVLNKYPQLKPTAPVPGATNPSRERKLTIADIQKMTPEQINARWGEVQAVLAGG